jgi:hypothetical protein
MVNAGTLLDGARMYASAADAVNERHPNALHVLSHLLGMSIELALKAFLMHAGCSLDELKSAGHDLPALLYWAQEFGLEHTGSRDFVLNVLGANYQERLFAYPEEAMITVIMPWRLRQMADELINIAFVTVKGRSALAAMADEAGPAIHSKYPDDVNPSRWAVRAST